MRNKLAADTRPLWKSLLFSAVIIFLFFFIVDRALKIYDKAIEKKMSSEENKTTLTMLSERQLADYRKATELVLSPYLVFRQAPNFHSGTININSMGFRGKEVPKAKIPGIFRIIVTGGSGAMGYGSTSDKTAFPQVLEDLLNSETASRRFEVINAGLASAISMQEFVLITTELMDLEPDMIIVFDGFNDVAGSVINDRRPNYPWRFEMLEKAISASPTKLFINKRLRNFRLTKKILEFVEKKKKENLSRSYAPNYPAVDAYIDNMHRICRILKGCSVEPVLIMQPVLYFKKNPCVEEDEILRSQPEGLDGIVIPMFDKASSLLSGLSGKEGVMYLDFRDAFGETKDAIFFDIVHFGDRGQAMVASRIFEALKKSGRVREALNEKTR